MPVDLSASFHLFERCKSDKQRIASQSQGQRNSTLNTAENHLTRQVGAGLVCQWSALRPTIAERPLLSVPGVCSGACPMCSRRSISTSLMNIKQYSCASRALHMKPRLVLVFMVRLTCGGLKRTHPSTTCRDVELHGHASSPGRPQCAWLEPTPRA